MYVYGVEGNGGEGRRRFINQYTVRYISKDRDLFFMAKLICDQCGKEVYKLAYVNENGNRMKLCPACYDKLTLDAMEVPETVILRDKQLAFMGTFEDKTPRLIISIPKDRNEDFDPNKHYDIFFKVRP